MSAVLPGPMLGIVTASRWSICLRCWKHTPERRLERGGAFWFSRERHACPYPIALADLIDPDEDVAFGDGGVA